MVGIFWFVGERSDYLVHDGVQIDAAEDYGGFKTYDGAHYEFWENLRASGPSAIKTLGLPAWLVEYEYEDFPRGRVVYDILNDNFIIYIDPKLNYPKPLAKIINAFELNNDRYQVLFDHHYQSTETIV